MALRRHFPTDRMALLELIDSSHRLCPTICHNTTAERDYSGSQPPIDSDVLVRYHGHAIVTLHGDGSVTLGDCGWRTSTTKERLMRFAPYGVRIWQENYVWYYTEHGTDVPRQWPGSVRFDRDGQVWRELCPTCEVYYDEPQHSDIHYWTVNQ